MSAVYCKEWNSLTLAPRDLITERAARRRFEEGPWFSVVLDGESGTPRAVIEMQPGPAVAKVFQYTAAGSIDRIFTFRRDGERMRLTDTMVYTYADDGCHDPSDSTVIESVLLKPDGTARRIRKDKSQPSPVVEERTGIDVGALSLPVPEFGDWEPLATWDLH